VSHVMLQEGVAWCPGPLEHSHACHHLLSQQLETTLMSKDHFLGISTCESHAHQS